MRISDWSSDLCSSDLDLVIDADFGLGARRGLFLAVENTRGLGLADRPRLARRSEEACDLGRVLDEVIDVIGHRQLLEHIAGEEIPFSLHLLAALDLGHRLDPNIDHPDNPQHPHTLGPADHRIAHLLPTTPTSDTELQ